MSKCKQIFKCPDCEGKGEFDVESLTYNIEYPVKCDTCFGTGTVSRSIFYRYYYRPSKGDKTGLTPSTNPQTA